MTRTQLELTLPGDPANAVVIRTMAGDAAASTGLSYDRWGDLELAVDEMTSLLLGGAPVAIRCVLRPTDAGVAVEMSALDVERSVPSDELAEMVLAGVTADLSLMLDTDLPMGSFVVATS